MATAQTFPAHPQPATNVSATNVFHRPKWAALTALTPGIGAPVVSGGADFRHGAFPVLPEQKLRGRSFRANPSILLVEPNGIEPLTSTMPL